MSSRETLTPAEAIISEFIALLAVVVLLGLAPAASKWTLTVVFARAGGTTTSVSLMLAQSITTDVGALGHCKQKKHDRDT